MTLPVALSRFAIKGPHPKICLTFSKLITSGLTLPANLRTTQERSRISFYVVVRQQLANDVCSLGLHETNRLDDHHKYQLDLLQIHLEHNALHGDD